jgi:hypothetical protein
MPTINLTDDELAALKAAIRRAIERPLSRAPRLDPLRSALAKLDPTTGDVPNPRRQADPAIIAGT